MRTASYFVAFAIFCLIGMKVGANSSRRIMEDAIELNSVVDCIPLIYDGSRMKMINVAIDSGVDPEIIKKMVNSSLNLDPMKQDYAQ